EIEAAVNKPILMELPFEKNTNSIVVLGKNNFAISEHFRMLRTHLHFLHNQNHTGRVTLLTSSISEEGKSFIASNLGAALAVSGRKTVILELDLRRPMISEIFKLDGNNTGISNFLMNQASMKEIIKTSGILDNLDIIPSGVIPNNPSELLEQAKIEELVTYLRNEYDD